MGNYIGTTSQEQKEMLQALQLNSLEELFQEIPAAVKLDQLDLPAGQSEFQVKRQMEKLANQNKIFSTIFRGAGAYQHYIPAIVPQIAFKEEFVTAYTPYQAEISQGILQSIFEYQTLICEITGMDATDASAYDGATAAAESIHMCTDKKRKTALIAATLAPMVKETIKTYYANREVKIIEIPQQDGLIDLAALESLMDETVACVLVPQINFYGSFEAVAAIIEKAQAKKIKTVVYVQPTASAILKTPGEMGADIAVGEAQSLGLPLNFGGAYIGFITTTSKLIRRLPGRISGETVDVAGKRAYVLTLQAREQHIRREKANSNICSNVAHCALNVSIYLNVMGPKGLKKVAQQSYDKAHYMAAEFAKLPGVKIINQSFFNEFVTELPLTDEEVLAKLAAADILGGLPTERGLLWCATEVNSKEEIDQAVAIVAELIQKREVVKL